MEEISIPTEEVTFESKTGEAVTIEMPDMELEEIQKIRYDEYCISHRVEMERITDSAAGSFWSMNDKLLKTTAKSYDVYPFNYLPSTADALERELRKRGLNSDADKFKILLQKVDWYNKPWIRY